MPSRPPHDFLVHSHADVLGIKVSAIDMKVALQLTGDCLGNGCKGYICVTGVHGVMEAQRDTQLRSILNAALINTPDGMPMSWVGWAQGYRGMNRVYGPDFMIEVCKQSRAMGYTHFLYGGQEGVAELLAQHLKLKVPGLLVVGTYTPPFRPLTDIEEAALTEQVHGLRPDIVWVGLSTPKQELFMAAHTKSFNVPLMVGVGAAFDIHTGRTKDAPDWMKRAGLQWAHRMLHEPKRLGPRYLRSNPDFMVQITKQLLGMARTKWIGRTYDS